MAIPTSDSARRLQMDGAPEILTFLQTARESDGDRTLVEVELPPGQGNPLHQHRTYAERFEVLEGELTIERDGEVLTLAPGDVAEAPIGSVHRFANDSPGRVVFRCELTPGHRGFEEMQQVIFGLYADGKVAPGALPKDPFLLGLLIHWADVQLAGRSGAAVGRLMGAAARLARATGRDRRLAERYVRW